MGMMNSAPKQWDVPFLSSAQFRAQTNASNELEQSPWALIILNTPFSRELLSLVWNFCLYAVQNSLH